jgi:hypothetical protein
VWKKLEARSQKSEVRRKEAGDGSEEEEGRREAARHEESLNSIKDDSAFCLLTSRF